MAIQKTEAMILKTMPFRSTSLIVTFFTRNFGKIRGIIKGVRQEGEMRGGIFELFSRIEIIYYEKTRSDLHLVTESFLLDSYTALHGSLESIAYAGYFSDLVDQVSEIHDPHEAIFNLLEFAYAYLSCVPGPRMARLFEIKLLHEIGWLPHLENCLNCGTDVLKEGYFSSRQGSLLCANCAPKFPDAKPLNAEPLSILRHYVQNEMDACLKLSVSRAAETELELFMSRFLLERLNKPLKSQIFLQKIKSVLTGTQIP